MDAKSRTALILILLFAFALRVPGFYEYLAWDEGYNAYVAHSMAGGVMPYRDIPIDREPGIFFLYKAIFGSLGEDPLSVRLVAAASVCTTTFILFYLVRLLAGITGGLVAAFFYALAMGGVANCGIRANTEVFMTLPSVLTYLFTYLALRRMDHRLLIASGVFAGLNCVLKLSGVMDIAGVTVLVLAFGGPGGLKDRTKGFLYLLAGIIAAAAPFIIVLYLRGLLGQAWEQIILWRFRNVAVAAAETTPYTTKMADAFLPIIKEEAGLWAVAVPSFLWAALSGRRLEAALPVIWLVFSTAAVSMTGMFTAYYFPLIAPPLAVLAGCGLSAFHGRFKGHSRQAAVAAVALALAVSAALTFAVGRGYYENFAKAWADNKAGRLDDYGFHKMLQSDVVDFYDAAWYVRDHTGPGDTVLFWMDSGEFYWQSDRRPPLPDLTPIPAGRDPKEEAALKGRLMDAIMKKPPEYIAVRDAVMYQFNPPVRSLDELKKFTGLNDFLEKSYELEYVTGRIAVYRHIPGGAVKESVVFYPEFMAPTVGYLLRQDWFMYSDGSLTASFDVGKSAGPVRFEMVMGGANPRGGRPHVSVSLDGGAVSGFDVSAEKMDGYVFRKQIAPGRHEVRITYDNDTTGPDKGALRDLLFRRLVISYDRA